MPPLRVLTLCVGNICRSPMAERLLAARLVERGVGELVSVRSAGVRAVVGSRMHPQSRVDTRALGGVTRGFRARQATRPLLGEAELLLTATQGVRAAVLEEEPAALRRTFTLREFAALAESAPPGLGVADLIADCDARRSTLVRGEYDVPDPVRAPVAVFAEVARQVSAATTSVADSLERSLRVSRSVPLP